MKKKTLTAREVRESQFLFRAPLFAVPLLTVLFWAFGGGKGLASSAKGLARGFIMRLPGPHVVPVTKLDKMGYYELAKKDSVAARQKEKVEDNYARQLGLDDGKVDPVVRKVQEKLGELKLAMTGRRVAPPGRTDVAGGMGRPVKLASEIAAPGPDINKLERMMGVLQRDEGGNSEIAQLSAVLDKLMAVEKPKVDSGSVGKVSAVVRPVLPPVKALPDEEDTVSGFDSSAIEAIVPEEQVLVGKGELRMELVKDIMIAGQLVPAGTELLGLATMNGERLGVAVHALTANGRTFSVNLLAVYQDGMPGLYVPGAPVADAVRESGGEDLGAIGPTMLTTNLAGQAANAGINLARSLIGKKIRPVKVTVPAGYQVLLHVQNQVL